MTPIKKLVEEARRSPMELGIFIMVMVISLYVSASILGVLKPSPHVTVDMVNAQTDGETVTFNLVGVKHDDSKIDTIAASWIYSDNTAMPAPMTRINGTPLNELADRVSAEEFVSSTLLVESVPRAVITDPGSYLRVCLVYHQPPELACTGIDYADIPTR